MLHDSVLEQFGKSTIYIPAMDSNEGDSTRGNEVVRQTKDMPRHVTSRIVVGLRNIVYFFLLDGNVDD